MGHENTTPMDLEQECETWDWARTAGVSAQELRDTLKASQLEGESVEAA